MTPKWITWDANGQARIWWTKPWYSRARRWRGPEGQRVNFANKRCGGPGALRRISLSTIKRGRAKR